MKTDQRPAACRPANEQKPAPPPRLQREAIPAVSSMDETDHTNPSVYINTIDIRFVRPFDIVTSFRITC